MDVNAIYRDLSDGFNREIREQLLSSSKQLANWLVLGNAAALAFTLSASINPSFPPELPVKWIYALFFAGLASSFLAMLQTTAGLGKVVQEIAALHIRLVNSHYREFLADELQEKGIAPPADWEEVDKQDAKTFEEAAKMGDRLKQELRPARMLSVVSMLTFAAGLSCPVFFLRG